MTEKQNHYDLMADIDNLRETALDFAEAGFKTIRLHPILETGDCGCGWAQCKNAGKHPAAKNWSKIPLATVDNVEALFDTGVIKHGMGVVLDSEVVIVDVDSKNDGLSGLKQLEADLGEPLESCCTFIVDSGSGNGSRHYWFKKDPDIKIKKTTKEYKGIDFLSAGCFVVMPNSLHKSGSCYTFPFEKKSHPDKISDAPQELIQKIERQVTISEDRSEPGSCDIAELREALEAIPNDEHTEYDDVWLPIGMALHHETGGSQHGFNLWIEWSEKGPKHDDSQMTYKWDSFANGGFGGSKYTGGTIFHMAQEAGWNRDYSKLVDLTPFLDRMKTGEVQQLEIKKDDKVYKSNKLPTSLKNAPGMIGIITDYIMSQAPKPLYMPSLAAALTYCGTVLGRDYKTDQENYTGTYTIIVAPTGSGKEKPRSMIKDILVNTNQGKVVSNAPTSKGAISTALIECPRVQFQIDEIGHFIESGNGRNASQNKIDVRSTLMELYGLSGSTYLPEKYSRMGEYKHGLKKENGEEVETVDLTVQKPFVSVFGMTTPAKLTESMTRMMIQDGFINRFTIVQAQEGRQKMQKVTHRPIPQSVLNWTETALRRSPSALASTMKDVFDSRTGENVINFSSESTDLISDFEDKIIAKQNKLEKEGLDELYSRTVEQAMRYALIVELSQRPESSEIQKESTEWAIEYVKYNAEQFEKLVKFELVETKHEALFRDGLKAIAKGKSDGVQHSTLMSRSPFRSQNKQTREEILKYLIDTEQILVDNQLTGGKPKKTYYSTEFVKIKEQ